MGNHADQVSRLEDHVGDRIVLPLIAVEHRFPLQRRRRQPGRDNRPENAEGIEALGPHPLGEGLVLADQFRRGNVVDAGVTEDKVLGVGL